MRALISLLLMGSFPAVLTKPLPGAIEPGKHWSWPAPADFVKAFDERLASGRSFRVVFGTLRAHETQHYDEQAQKIVPDPKPAWADVERMSECKADHAVYMLDEEQQLHALLPNGEWCEQSGWKIVSREGKALRLETDVSMAVLTLTDETDARAVPEKYLTDWTYAATLLKPMGNSAALLADYDAHAPMGHCSMDRGPQIYASEFADKCYAKGELACFLQIQIKVMGDQFNRVAWSSYGEASHPTYASQLEKTGIDVDRFFRGLVLVLPGERKSQLGPSRLARALMESGRQEKFESLLMDMAQDEALDTMNRYRAFTTYVSMQYRAEEKDVPAKVAPLKLDALSKAWWDAAQREK